MDVIELETACHSARYCALTGGGRLVLPLLDDDLGPMGAGGLHTADGLHMLALLRALGVEPAEDDEFGGPWAHVGYLPDGREVVALWGLDPVVSDPSPEQLAEVDAALDLLVGLVPMHRRAEGAA